MKKILLSVFALTAYLGVNAQCNELFISEYVEGTGNDKAIEIYNPTNNPINLTGYTIARYSNGASTSSAGGVTNLTGTIAAHDVFILVNGQLPANSTPTSPACSPVLQAMADQLDHAYPAPTYFNGNDALVLFNGATIVDIFGKTGDAAMTSGYGWSDAFPYDGSAGAIWTENHTLVRKSSITQGVATNPTTFIVTAEWDSLPVNTWSGLGTHASTCYTGINEIDNSISVVVYPNPTSSFFNISTSEFIEMVQVFNVVGQQVINQKGNKAVKTMKIETADLPKGVYFVKVSFANNKNSIAKLTIN